jgi:hypothetical protein
MTGLALLLLPLLPPPLLLLHSHVLALLSMAIMTSLPAPSHALAGAHTLGSLCVQQFWVCEAWRFCTQKQ